MTLTEFEALRLRLLGIAGSEVKPPPGGTDNAIDELLRDGREYPLPVSVCNMQPQYCHANIALLWQQGLLVAICTGYALDADGTAWRQHWWGLSARGIVETTEHRSRYFGIDYSGKDADNIAGGIVRKLQSSEDHG